MWQGLAAYVKARGQKERLPTEKAGAPCFCCCHCQPCPSDQMSQRRSCLSEFLWEFLLLGTRSLSGASFCQASSLSHLPASFVLHWRLPFCLWIRWNLRHSRKQEARKQMRVRGSRPSPEINGVTSLGGRRKFKPENDAQSGTLRPRRCCAS